MYEGILLDRYKTCSNEELEEVKVSNGYTEGAEQIARQFLGKDVIECREDTDASEQELKKYEKDVVYCINCGAECPEGAKFCMKCGFKVVRKEQVERGYTRDDGIAIDSAYKKLGGWLAFLAYGHLVSGVLIGIGAVIEIFAYMKISKEYSQYGMPLNDAVVINYLEKGRFLQ